MLAKLKKLFGCGPEAEIEDTKPLEFRCGDINIELPPGHGLKFYQEKYPRYDRFLPHLSKFLPIGSTVIDIGANCADTVAAMVQENPGVRYVCVEPDDEFYGYLLRNLERIRKVFPETDITAVKSASLVGEKGSKHAVLSDYGLITETVDAIVSRLGCEDVRLLKSDVDSFDFDVLAASEGIFSTDRPLVFFECQFENEMQMAGFLEILSVLERAGYKKWAVFDNFGELMLERTTKDQIEQLLAYVWKQHLKLATRTIYYYDIFAYTERESCWAGEAVRSYGATFVKETESVA